MTTATASRRRKTTGIEFQRHQLLGLIEAVDTVVPSKTPRPILQNVCLRDGVLTANNLELQIAIEIDWPHEPLLLPHARLKSVLRLATGDTVTLKPDGTACHVAVGRGEWRLPVEEASEFPIAEPKDLVSVCRIPCDQFARAVKSVSYALDDTSTRFALGAVCIEVAGDKCHFVATDGRRLAVATVCHDQAVDDREVLVPKDAIQLIAGIAGQKVNEEFAVQLEVSRSELVATIGGTTITARLTEGKFPAWRDVIPERQASEMHTVDLAELERATRAAAIVTTETSKGVDYAFTREGIRLHAQSSESGESTVLCDLVDAGVGGVVKLDPKYVAETCKALAGLDDQSSVRVSIAGPNDKVLILCGEDDEYRTVIMPLSTD